MTPPADSPPNPDAAGTPSAARHADRTVLFLCTGNYYRSRFAEQLWNALEDRERTGWRAASGGLTFANSGGNVGPLSPHARRALAARRIALPEALRMPRLVNEADLAAAALIVAVSRAEHRPMLIERFPAWADRIEYWDVEDVALCSPDEALDRLASHVERLRARLAGSSAGGSASPSALPGCR